MTDRNFVDCRSARGRAANFRCGCLATFALDIGSPDGTIRNAVFTTNGCGYMVAAADVLAETVLGKSLGELQGLPSDVFTERLRHILDIPPSQRDMCLKTALEALQNAFADLRERRIQEFRGEQTLICTCFGVSEETIEQIVISRRAKTADDVASVCNAGRGCGSCRLLIQEILDSAV